MAQYKTPGVHVKEIATLPPSVAEVSTAIPAFIGFTEKAGPNDDLRKVPTRINTFLEFKDLFGGPEKAVYKVNVDDKEEISGVAVVDDPDFLLYHHVDMYFRNGGGSCYIVSVGGFGTASKTDIKEGLDAVMKEDEPTLLMLSDATRLAKADYYSLAVDALSQCNTLGDRFAVLDVKDNNVEDFRKEIGSNYLKYGAAYTPYLETSLSHQYDEKKVEVDGLNLGSSGPLRFNTGPDGLNISYSGTDTSATAKILKTNSTGVTGIEFEVTGNQLTIRGVADGKTALEVSTAWTLWSSGNNPGDFLIDSDGGDGTGLVTSTSTTGVTLTAATGNQTKTYLFDLRIRKTNLYNKIHAALVKKRVTLPPSSAVAGVYASTDRDRGVWKAPANVSIASVIAPTEKINDQDQQSLNIDADFGKSINAIRSFSGKGTMVWGARTLAGNDNEWRYVSVRRLFNLIEESTRKSTSFAVFEANDPNTWLKVKAMIETYLYGLWERGALMGVSSSDAYFVNIGLGKTMTQDDILNGVMNVEIGLAAVRPAEFIVLKFSHQLAEG